MSLAYGVAGQSGRWLGEVEGGDDADNDADPMLLVDRWTNGESERLTPKLWQCKPTTKYKLAHFQVLRHCKRMGTVAWPLWLLIKLNFAV